METTESKATNKLTLDDIHVGQIFRSETYTIDAEKIKEFAREFDPQPFHLDEETAKKTFFRQLVASGWHTAAITMRLMVSSIPFAGGLIGAGGEIAWLGPTKPGDTLHVETEVIEIRTSRKHPERGTATICSTTINQKGERLQTITSRVIVPTAKS